MQIFIAKTLKSEVARMSLIDREKTMEEIPIDVCDGFEVTDIKD